MKPALKAITLLLFLLPPATGAGTVYSWTDANGVTHFSQHPPADTSQEMRRIEVDTPSPVQSPVDDDYFSVLNQARRMQDSRLEREKVRAERLRAEAEVRRAEAEAQAANRSYDDADHGSRYYVPLWGSYRWPGQFPGHRPGQHPGRPGHLPSRPTHKPSRPVVGIPSRR